LKKFQLINFYTINKLISCYFLQPCFNFLPVFPVCSKWQNCVFLAVRYTGESLFQLKIEAVESIG